MLFLFFLKITGQKINKICNVWVYGDDYTEVYGIYGKLKKTKPHYSVN